MDRSLGPAAGRRFDEDQLLDAARAVFHGGGFSAAQISEIARRAGTTKPTLYARFGNKEDLYLRVVEREAAVLDGWIREAYDIGLEMPLAELADVGMDPVFRLAAGRPEGFDLLFRGDMAGAKPAALRRRVLAGITEQLTELIDRRRRRLGPPLEEAIASGLAAACVGVALQVCEQAIDNGHDLKVAHHLAARFVEGSIRNLDTTIFEAGPQHVDPGG
ncbi:MAG: TetR/AcrR family transcriptional regulator [Actinobacteria bacterium]|nr:TetR/AcrR family transcriptional regulator [Actinomycetota bacterium]